MTPHDPTPTLAAVCAARDAHDAAGRALEDALTPEQRPLHEAVMDAAEARYRDGWWHLAGSLAELLPGVGPAILALADEIERRIDHTPPAA
jgi:hypothetical protein